MSRRSAAAIILALGITVGVLIVQLFPPAPSAQPLLVFNWHGYRAGLDADGMGGVPVGLDDLGAAGVTHVGLPQDHTGDFGHRNYIAEIRAQGIRIVRTTEQPWNAGLHGRDLGGIILDWESPEQPGLFFAAYARHLQAPCHGIGWNLEHDIVTPGKYPLTDADRKLGHLWSLDLTDPEAYVHFRCRQFALIFQMYFEVARHAHPTCELAIGYSGYAGLRSRNLPISAAYGCDWSLQAVPQEWRGHRFRPITHAMCAWHATAELPPAGRTPNHPLPILHTIQLAPALERDSAQIRAQIRDRLALLRPGDGLGAVGYGSGPVWDGEDRRIHRLIGEELRSRKTEIAGEK